MLIYSGTKSGFMSSIEDDTLEEMIESTIKKKLGRTTNISEFNSWRNSLPKMYIALNTDDIPDDTGVSIEYNIPQTSKRIDFILSGYDKERKPNVVIVELKQWESVKSIQGQDGLVETYTGHAMRQVVHPSYQAWSYSMMLKDYNTIVENSDISLSPCAYLHNYNRKDNDPLFEEQYKIYLDEAPLFSSKEQKKLQAFIKKCITYGDKCQIMYQIDKGRIKPSKSLQDSILKMVKGNHEFILLDDQKIVYEAILKAARSSFKDNRKRVLIISGGPGTGKTVVAVNLLCTLTNENQFVQYVSKNSAPREVYKKKLKGSIRISSIDNMFKGSGIYTDALSNAVNTIIVDEAHRLNEKSGLFHNKGENQIKEIINSSYCSVFFIDEHQRVTINDIGTIDEIKKWADIAHAEVTQMELTSQFRCNGSDGYLAWVDNTLQIRDTSNMDMSDIDYDVRVLDSPSEMFSLIKQKNQETGNKARILAGYCWDWIKGRKNDSSVHDIKIGDFEISWNLEGTTTWAIDEDSVDEAGCIHTSQGLEFEYVGVIIGDDMRYENGKIVTDFTKRAKTDQSIKGLKKLYEVNETEALRKADEIIKNTYRTLLTRGMKGCYIYCTDKKLSDYLRSRIQV